ncbi:hypothetical protein E2C01_035427 [Portunus trituberculatus]|uniref:Uncharacterized protein n=1 Tax=Portunus trituberculatus TaxID=210409 RepID=A0A5B7F461_PORTR|nr:hypothetical protein [Portunus trituberculatus]
MSQANTAFASAAAIVTRSTNTTTTTTTTSYTTIFCTRYQSSPRLLGSCIATPRPIDSPTSSRVPELHLLTGDRIETVGVFVWNVQEEEEEEEENWIKRNNEDDEEDDEEKEEEQEENEVEENDKDKKREKKDKKKRKKKKTSRNMRSPIVTCPVFVCLRKNKSHTKKQNKNTVT